LERTPPDTARVRSRSSRTRLPRRAWRGGAELLRSCTDKKSAYWLTFVLTAERIERADDLTPAKAKKAWRRPGVEGVQI
jgi:hypothetical protein